MRPTQDLLRCCVFKSVSSVYRPGHGGLPTWSLLKDGFSKAQMTILLGLSPGHPCFLCVPGRNSFRKSSPRKGVGKDCSQSLQKKVIGSRILLVDQTSKEPFIRTINYLSNFYQCISGKGKINSIIS